MSEEIKKKLLMISSFYFTCLRINLNLRGFVLKMGFYNTWSFRIGLELVSYTL